MSELLPGFYPTESEAFAALPTEAIVIRAIALLKEHEPAEGYYLAFSGGKDSVAVKKLAELSGVRFEARYNQTTIDPPELIRFIKAHHADVEWNRPKINMMARVATAPKVPPTRLMRWCCSEYKEAGGHGRIKIMGVRKEESPKRALRWREVAEDMHKNKTICPIVLWSTVQLWAFIHAYQVPYCELYDQGFDRLGCVDCPLATEAKRAKERERWPKMADNWKKAVIANWEKWKDVPREDGKPRYHTKFRSGEDFYEWWKSAKAPDYFREECQGGLLWTNEQGEDEPPLDPNPSPSNDQ